MKVTTRCPVPCASTVLGGCTAQNQQHRASGLALVTAATVLWNTICLGRALEAARRGGDLIPDALLAHLAPLGWQHIDLTGEYLWNAASNLGPDGFRPLRDFPDRKLACIAPVTAYADLQPLLGRRIKTDVIREHWSEILRLVAPLNAGTVLPSAMLRRLSAYQRQNQLDLALQKLGRIERTLFMLD